MKRFLVIAALVTATSLVAQNSPQQQQADNDPPFVKQARQLAHDGKLGEALTVYENELKSSPDSQDALIGAGAVLDLELKGAEARKYFQKAIDTAKDDEARADANRAMAMSWAFESNCQMAGVYEQKVLDFAKAKGDFTRAGEVANEAGRVCMDSSDVERGMLWYEEGHKLALQQPNITPEGKDLWDFRLENAQARAASHLTDDDDPQPHIAKAKAILDKGTNPQQAQFLPSLQGYVAYYTKDYKGALGYFQQANQNDPFIQCMLAMTYEKLGDNEHAMEFYKKAAMATGHNPAAAFAVPRAKKKLATMGR
jgi:tetratricopeptide (TPR) repeat protein